MKKLFLVVLIIITSFVGARGQWEDCSNGGPGSIVNILESSGNYIFAGVSPEGIYFSSDNGNTWLKRNFGLVNTWVSAFVIGGNNIFVGTDFSLQKGNIFLSTDNANTWNKKDSGMPSIEVLSLAIMGKNIFAGTINGLFISSNNGNQWAKLENSLAKINVYRMDVCGNNFFAGTSDGLYISRNGGYSWSQNNYDIKDTRINIFKSNTKNIIAGTAQGIYLSTNNGSSWKIINSGISNYNVFSLAYIGNNIFAGTWYGSILLSKDNGNTWKQEISGFPTNSCVNSLTFNSIYIFAATNDGVFRAKLSGFGITDVLETQPSTSDFQIFPNPASDFIEISGVGAQNFVPLQNNIRIFNILGECVPPRLASQATPQEGNLKIDVSGLAPGVYYLKIGDEVKMFVKQ